MYQDDTRTKTIRKIFNCNVCARICGVHIGNTYKMKTAMKELWDVLNDAEQNGVYEIGTQNFKRYIDGIYLQKEKQQIIDAYEKDIDSNGNLSFESGEQYFNETFEQ